MNIELPRLRIFLSYSSRDKSKVRSLYDRLKKDGYVPWLDEEDLLPGQNWPLEIKSAISEAGVVLICLSSEAISRKGYFQKEIRQALDEASKQPDRVSFIIPVLLEECELPDSLKIWHWYDIQKVGAYDRLLKSLDTRAEYLGLKLGGSLNYESSQDEEDVKYKRAAVSFSTVKPSRRGPREPELPDVVLGKAGKGDAYQEKRANSEESLPEGEYRVTGTAEDGTSYRGLATIRVFNSTVFILSRIGPETHVCKGVLKGKKLEVDGDFDVSYVVNADGSLDGVWGTNRAGTEKLTPLAVESRRQNF